MRPARKGPENAGVARGGGGGAECFNEAGPQGAGKRSRSWVYQRLQLQLQ